MTEDDERALIELARTVLYYAFHDDESLMKKNLLNEAKYFGINNIKQANDFMDRVDP